MTGRAMLALALALPLAGCWTPRAGQVDPTRYPWDQPATYCVISLELPTSGGITTGGTNMVNLPCQEPPRRRRPRLF